MEKAEQSNKIAIIAIVCTFLIAGLLAFAFTNNSPNNKLASIFKQKITLPAGTNISTVLNSTVDSATSNIGDIVVATVTQDVIVGNKLLIPQGSKVFGTVSFLEKATNTEPIKSGAVALSFSEIQTSNGNKISISASTPARRGEIITSTTTAVVGRSKSEKFGSGAKSAVLGAAAGAALGTAVGAIAGGGRGAGRGAWSGAAIGGGLGTARGVYGAVKDPGKVISVTKQTGSNVIMKSGELVIITTDKAVEITPQVIG